MHYNTFPIQDALRPELSWAHYRALVILDSADKKAPIKSADKRITAKAQSQMEAILASMEPGIWYRSSDLMGVLNLKETRTKELLRLLVSEGKLIEDGTNKWKRYQLK